tara:strand:- start:58 stop:408 length:351 start_codon:yes stop_codon:yes gene_type:complete
MSGYHGVSGISEDKLTHAFEYAKKHHHDIILVYCFLANVTAKTFSTIYECDSLNSQDPASIDKACKQIKTKRETLKLNSVYIFNPATKQYERTFYDIVPTPLKDISTLPRSVREYK